MAESRVESLDLRSKTPRPNPVAEGSFDFYIAKLKKERKVTIPCPHGHGNYHIKLEGSQWYETPEVVFEASETCPHPYNKPAVMQAGRFRTNKGRAIPWYPNNMFAYQGAKGAPLQGDEYMFQLGRFIIGYILSGRRLYKLKCGQSIHSLNDDGTIGVGVL